MSRNQKTSILIALFSLAVIVLSPMAGIFSVAAQTGDPIPGYINQINSTNLINVATDLVTLYAPRRDDTYSPYISGTCILSSTVYPKTTIEMSADYVKARFEAMGYAPSAITMEAVPGNAGHNVYVTKVGSTYPNVFIEFGAHMDTVPGSPGGNDNASGSTAVVELARVLKDYPSRYSLRFVLYVAEEYEVRRGAAFYGSAYHVQQILARGEQIKAALVMDHIGWPYPSDPTGYFNEVSYIDAESNRIANLFNQVRTDYGISIGFGKDQGIQNSDEHSYWNAGLTAVSSGGGWLFYRPNYHECGDGVSNINFTNVLRTAQQNLAVGLKLDAETISQSGTPTTTPTRTATATSGPSPTPSNTPTMTHTPNPNQPFPSTGILDNFNRSDGSVGSNWSGNTSGYNVQSNQLDVGTSEDMFWNTTSFGSNQEVFVKLGTVDPAASEIGLVLKSQSNSGFTAGLIDVVYIPASNVVEVWTYASSQNWVKRGTSIPVTFVNGDQYGAQASSDGTVRVFRNGVLLGSRDVTAWPFNANGGYIGLFNLNASNAVLDDFGGGNPGSGATATPTATRTATLTATNTAVATATNTPLPTATNTAAATATNTPLLTATNTAAATATNTPAATATNTPVATATNTPVPDLIFADGFEAGNLSGWTANVNDGGDLSSSQVAALVGTNGLRAVLDDNNSIYVTDDNPLSELRYRARFYFDPNTITMTNGNAHYIFYGYTGTSTVVVRVGFRLSQDNYQIQGGVRSDGGIWTNTAWFTISDGQHAIEFDWQAATASGANNGGLTLWIDGLQSSNITGIDNDTRRIDRVRLGPISGIDSGTRGTYYFDAFESRRGTYIGP